MIKRIFFNVTSRNKNKRRKMKNLLHYHPHCLSFHIILQVLLLFCLQQQFFPAVFRSEENSFLFILLLLLFDINSFFLFIYFTSPPLIPQYRKNKNHPLMKDNTQIIFNKSSFFLLFLSFKYPFSSS